MNRRFLVVPMAISLRLNKRIAGIIGGVLVVLAVFLIPKLVPYAPLDTFLSRQYSSVYTDRNGTVLQVRPVENGSRRQFTPLNELPGELVQAFLKAEDSRFYWHYGVDVIAVIRAAAQNIAGQRAVSGASTITMQLARMVFPSEKRTFWTKIGECGKAFLLESKLPKKQILELYLNTVPFGNNVEGVTSAAWYYFGKTPATLTHEEMLCLAVIPRRPVSYNPIEYPDHTAAAAWYLVPRGSDITWDSLLSTATSATVHSWPFLAPHAVLRAGDSLHLTIDADIQALAEFELTDKLDRNPGHRIDNGACIVIDNATGQILAYVGSNDWFDDEHSGQIDGITVRNQMGSSMKPFLYAAALEQQVVKPADVLADIPTDFGSSTVYFPQNFNNRFNGPVMLRKALASSLNIPAVTTLSQLGVSLYLRYLEKLGFHSLSDGSGLQADLGLALGAGEVTLEELTRAFSVFPNDGQCISLSLSMDDPTGTRHRVYSEDIARILCDMLSDKSARSGGFGTIQTFQTEYPSIFKTGTANQYQNIVAIGATPRYTVGVWMGNFSGNTVMGKTGSSMPAAIGKVLLDYLTERDTANGLEPLDFKPPEEYAKVTVCSVSGKKPTSACLHTVREYYHVQDMDSLEYCSWHVREKNNTIRTTIPALYESWLMQTGNVASVDYDSSPLTITTPASGSVFYKAGNGSNQQIPVMVIGGGDSETFLQVTYDNLFFVVERPFSFVLPVEQGVHTLQVSLGSQSETITFTVR